MTREEAIKGLKVLRRDFSGYKPNEEMFDMAIKELEQEPIDDVLDKIRAEIEQNAYPIVHGVNNHEKGMTLYGILQVIDKYRKVEE